MAGAKLDVETLIKLVRRWAQIFMRYTFRPLYFCYALWRVLVQRMRYQEPDRETPFPKGDRDERNGYAASSLPAAKNSGYTHIDIPMQDLQASPRVGLAPLPQPGALRGSPWLPSIITGSQNPLGKTDVLSEEPKDESLRPLDRTVTFQDVNVASPTQMCTDPTTKPPSVKERKLQPFYPEQSDRYARLIIVSVAFPVTSL